RGLRMVDERTLELTGRGRALVNARETRYNERLIEAVESYLRAYGLSRGAIETALKAILDFRGIPSRGEVFDRLAHAGRRVPTSNLGMILDILGYAGAVRMTTERAYFP